MKPSNNCIEFIKKEEGGCYLKAYRDQAGIATIGYGSTMFKDGKRVRIEDQITKEQAEELIHWEVDNKSKSVAAFTSNVLLTQNQFDSLVSFAFNCGIGALQHSTLLKKVVRNPNDPTIRDEFMKWNKITLSGKKVESKGLTLRRKREADLYFKTN